MSVWTTGMYRFFRQLHEKSPSPELPTVGCNGCGGGLPIGLTAGAVIENIGAIGNNDLAIDYTTPEGEARRAVLLGDDCGMALTWDEPRIPFEELYTKRGKRIATSPTACQ